MDEKTISSSAFKLIAEALDWTEEDNRDFYNYASGVVDLTNMLIGKLDEKKNEVRD